MKILYTLRPLYPDKPGGVENYVLELVKGMISRGHEVHVLCNPGKICDGYEQAGAHVNRYSLSFDIDPVFIYKVYKYIKKEKFDVIHSNDALAGFSTLLAAKLAGNIVKVSHQHTQISEWVTPNLFKEISKRLLIVLYAIVVRYFSDKEIALTESRKRIKVKDGINAEKIIVIPNGINTDKFDSIVRGTFKSEIINKYGLENDTFIFGNVSRISEEKGHDVLINAFKVFFQKHLAKNQNVSLLLAGGGILEKQIRNKIHEFEMDSCIKVTGVFDDEDKVKLYSTFDAFVFPSRVEGFGIVLIEAMSAGLPIICSDLEVLQEVGGSSVFYFADGDPEDLAQKMVDLYSRRDNLTTLVDSARQRVRELYTLDKFEENYENLYMSLLENRT